MAILLDASFLVALENTDDIHHKRARELWESLANEQKVISDYVFDEIIGVTLRKVGKDRARILGGRIIETVPLLMIDKELFKEAWELFKKENLSFTDCTLVVLAKLGKLSIATFDKELRKVYTDVLPK